MSLPGPIWLWALVIVLVVIFVLNKIGVVTIHFQFAF
jgi:hypothetical protein